MPDMQAELGKVLAQYNQKQDDQIKSLVKIYENMKPEDAANIFNQMEMPILLDVISKMSERKVALVLANMDPKRAKDVTQLPQHFFHAHVRTGVTCPVVAGEKQLEPCPRLPRSARACSDLPTGGWQERSRLAVCAVKKFFNLNRFFGRCARESDWERAGNTITR